VRPFRIQATGLSLSDGNPGTKTIREKVAGLLRLQFILRVHVRKNPNWRLGKLLAADSEDSDDEQRNQRVGEKKVTHLVEEI
jgi:hypothetical protein